MSDESTLQYSPDSIVNMLPPKLRQAVIDLNGDYTYSKSKLTPNDYRIRESFWHEYEKAALEGRPKIRIAAVCRGVYVHDSYFYTHWLKSRDKVAFLMNPVQTYNAQMTQMLSVALGRIEEVLTIPIIKKDGTHDVKAADIILRAARMLIEQVHGMAVQRVQTKSLNVHVTDTPNSIKKLENMDMLNDRIADLEKTLHPEKALPVAASEVIIDAQAD